MESIIEEIRVWAPYKNLFIAGLFVSFALGYIQAGLERKAIERQQIQRYQERPVNTLEFSEVEGVHRVTITSPDGKYNVTIPIITEEKFMPYLKLVVQAAKFHKYLQKLNLALLDITSITINAITWFCDPTKTPTPNQLGFLYINIECKDKRNGKKVPGIVFLRGDAVAVLTICEVERKEYVLLTWQPRVPGGDCYLEIPAGMMDKDSNFASVALKELEEETSIKVNHKDLIQLGSKISPSIGGCDEEIQLYFVRIKLTKEQMDKIQAKVHGKAEEGESIQVQFIPLDEFENRLCIDIGDVKALSAHHRAEKMGLLKKGLKFFSWI